MWFKPGKDPEKPEKTEKPENPEKPEEKRSWFDRLLHRERPEEPAAENQENKENQENQETAAVPEELEEPETSVTPEVSEEPAVEAEQEPVAPVREETAEPIVPEPEVVAEAPQPEETEASKEAEETEAAEEKAAEIEEAEAVLPVPEESEPEPVQEVPTPVLPETLPAELPEETEETEESKESEESEEPEETAEATETVEETVEVEAPEAPEKKSFWGKAWDVLNRPVFTIDESWVDNLRDRISQTRDELVQRVKAVALGHTRVDENLLEELEEILIESDIGISVTDEVLDHLRKEAKAGRLTPDGVSEALAHHLEGYLGAECPLTLEKGKFNVVLLVGVNGTGKTTTVGKLANRFQIEGFKPIIAAADTFRAAAIDQLEVWGERADVPVIRHREGGDAAAVVFDSIKAAQARGADVLLVDTAGRLQNKANLMSELAKIRRIIDREAPDSHREAWLVLDATTGQNGLKQAMVFKEAVQLTGVILTKLDGTAKGGVIFAICHDLGLPVKAIGLGEKLEDLKDFNPKLFVEALFGEKAD